MRFLAARAAGWRRKAAIGRSLGWNLQFYTRRCLAAPPRVLTKVYLLFSVCMRLKPLIPV